MNMLNRLQISSLICPIICCLTLALCATLAPASNAAPVRALWVWNGSSIITSSSQETTFFNFIAAPYGKSANAVGKLYFDSGTIAQFSNSTWVSEMSSFITTAHSKGVSVYFLCGDPTWAESSGESTGLSYMTAVINFNAAHTSSQFNGFQYDVEPYALSTWPSTTLENGLENLLWQAYNLKAASDPALALSETIPFWYDSAAYNYLDQGVMNLTDEVAIMDYTNSAANIISYPAAEINYASANGKYCWVGVETNQESGSPQTTFYSLGDTDMESVLSTDYSTFLTQSCFGGYCIDSYTGWSALGAT